MKNQTIYLTALFLALWLPSQALATVVVHCVTHDTDAHKSHSFKSDSQTSDIAHGIETTAAIEDCHGKPAAQAIPADTSDHHDANAPDCYHCTGGCHKLQPMLVLEREPQRTQLDINGTVMRSNNLAAGFPDFPIRPPITRLSV